MAVLGGAERTMRQAPTARTLP